MKQIWFWTLILLLVLQACKKEELEPESLYYKSGIWNIDKMEVLNAAVADSFMTADEAGFFIFYNMLINEDGEHYLGQKVLNVPGMEQQTGVWWSVNGNTVSIGNDAYNTAASKTYKVEKKDRSNHIWTFDTVFPGNIHYNEILHLSELKYK